VPAVRNVIAFRNTVLFNTALAVDLDKISEEAKNPLPHSVMVTVLWADIVFLTWPFWMRSIFNDKSSTAALGFGC